VRWHDGAVVPLQSCFARVRIRPARHNQPRDEEWLMIEWPEDTDEPAHHWFSNMDESMPWQAMVDTVTSRWRIERDHQELKQELGLGHYEGRNWRGFHHHASLCIAAYSFLMLEHLTGHKKRRRIQNTCLTQRLHPARAAATQRHEPTFIAACRFRLARAIARQLRYCPYCGQHIAARLWHSSNTKS
jgi:SRSO17 transposase